MSDFVNYHIIDCHTHIMEKHDPEAGARLVALAHQAGIDKMVVLALGELKWGDGNAPIMLAKARNPQELFWFAGLDYAAIGGKVSHTHTLPFYEQIERLWAMGADGLKIINGKPDFRKDSGIALDSPIYDPAFDKLAQLGMPLLWHVNDPEEFWDPEKAPAWASVPGWTYNETYPSKELIHEETERMVARHTDVKIIFAHFYFLSADLPRAGRFLDQSPNVYLDLAPGIEMLHNFSANLDAAREFFIKYQDRILFGTDLVENSPMSRVDVVRRCLETDEVFHVPTDEGLFWPDHRTTLRGMKLPEDVLKKIYAENFIRIVGKEPRPLDLEAVKAELTRLEALAEQLGVTPNLAQAARAALA